MPIFWAGIWPPPPAWANANPAASSIAMANAENVTRFICSSLEKVPRKPELYSEADYAGGAAGTARGDAGRGRVAVHA